MTQCLEHVIREHVFIVKKFATWKNRFLKDSTERVQLTWYLKPKKKKKHAKTYNMVTTVIRYHWLPTLRTCTNFHSSLICIKCQSFQSFIKLIFFLHMYMYRIFKKGFCSTCTVFEFLVTEYGNLFLYSSFGFQISTSCVCRFKKKMNDNVFHYVKVSNWFPYVFIHFLCFQQSFC